MHPLLEIILSNVMIFLFFEEKKSCDISVLRFSSIQSTLILMMCFWVIVRRTFEWKTHGFNSVYWHQAELIIAHQEYIAGFKRHQLNRPIGTSHQFAHFTFNLLVNVAFKTVYVTEYSYQITLESIVHFCTIMIYWITWNVMSFTRSTSIEGRYEWSCSVYIVVGQQKHYTIGPWTMCKANRLM